MEDVERIRRERDLGAVEPVEESLVRDDAPGPSVVELDGSIYRPTDNVRKPFGKTFWGAHSPDEQEQAVQDKADQHELHPSRRLWAFFLFVDILVGRRVSLSSGLVTNIADDKVGAEDDIDGESG